MEYIDIKFSGQSDDNFYIYGNGAQDIDYIGAFDKKISVKIEGHSGGCIIVGEYCPDLVKGCSWNFGVSQIDEDILIPDDWIISINQSDCAYSPELTVKIPKGKDYKIENITQ